MNARRTVDILMIITLPVLMAYSLVGETLHEAAGVMMTVLFSVHLYQNRKWFRSFLFKKAGLKMRVQAVIDWLLIAVMIMQPISGIIISKHLFAFIPEAGLSAFSRSVHMVLAYWAMLIMCVHAGFHIRMPEKADRKTAVLKAVIALASAWGAFSLFRRGVIRYMFLMSSFAMFDRSEPLLFFFLDYICIMVLYMAAGSLISKKLGEIQKGNRI